MLDGMPGHRGVVRLAAGAGPRRARRRAASKHVTLVLCDPVVDGQQVARVIGSASGRSSGKIVPAFIVPSGRRRA